MVAGVGRTDRKTPHPAPLCADRGHHLHVFGDMVYIFSDEVEDRNVPFAERRMSDLRAEFVAL